MDTRERVFGRVLPGSLIFLSFPVVGWFVGWFVGYSRSPVVATLIPVLIGLLGAVAYSVLERRLIVGRMLDEVNKLGKDGEVTQTTLVKLRGNLSNGPDSSYWLPALWAVGVVLFCVGCAIGTEAGIRKRVPPYPSVKELITRSTPKPIFVASTTAPEVLPMAPKEMPIPAPEPVPAPNGVPAPKGDDVPGNDAPHGVAAGPIVPEEPTPDELALLHLLRWHLQAKGIPPEEAKVLFEESIVPVLEMQQFDSRFRFVKHGMPPRTSMLQMIVENMLKSEIGITNMDYGPAPGKTPDGPLDKAT